ncbi:hypothetical protein [Akkermansia sp. UBA7090]|uniref:hypothetical protein n=1 Tax=Akkermansia sp. UBA7090 TaxID=1945966 RepID=UPI0025BFCD8D|nr:hypothetical protein [Akkermansia sp. UBA7090]
MDYPGNYNRDQQIAAERLKPGDVKKPSPEKMRPNSGEIEDASPHVSSPPSRCQLFLLAQGWKTEKSNRPDITSLSGLFPVRGIFHSSTKERNFIILPRPIAEQPFLPGLSAREPLNAPLKYQNASNKRL